jgi:hypothetical protein
MADVLEALFLNSFLEVALGFFCPQLAKFGQKKKTKTLLYNVCVSTCTA